MWEIDKIDWIAALHHNVTLGILELIPHNTIRASREDFSLEYSKSKGSRPVLGYWVDWILIKVAVSVPELAIRVVLGCCAWLETTWEPSKNQLNHQPSASTTTFTHLLWPAPLIFCHNLLSDNIYQLGKQILIGEGTQPRGTAIHKCQAHLEKILDINEFLKRPCISGGVSRCAGL